MSAQNTIRVIVEDSITGEKLIGVTMLLQNTENGAASGIDGSIELKNIPDGEHIFILNYLGYKKKNISRTFPLPSQQALIIKLTQDESQLEEVVVTTTRMNSRIEDAPIKVEVLGLEDLTEENSIKPGNVTSLLGDISSIQIQQTSPVNGNSVVRMQGLDGKYTLLLRDGVPSYGGLSGGLNILQIPPLDLKQIEIIKGPASTLNGGGAIAGMINFISKLPSDSTETAFTINQSTLTETNLNAYLSGTKDKIGYTMLGAYTTQQAVDVDKDNFSDVPLLHSFLLHPQFFYDLNKKNKLRLGLITSMEDRTGGDMQAIKNNYDSLHQYFDNIRSVRNGVDISFSNIAENKNELSFKSSINQFNRKEITNYSAFNGDQWNVYSELFYSIQKKNQNIIFGANYLLDEFNKLNNDTLSPDDYTYHTAGVFSQYGLNIENKLNLLAGLRADYHSEYGWFVLPSVAVLIHAGEKFSFRINGGTGYKAPNLLEIEEGSLNAHEPYYPFTQNIDAEQSSGGTAEWNYHKIFSNDVSLFINQTFFYTKINHGIFLTAQSNGENKYSNINGKVTTKGIDNYIRLSKHPYELYIGYTYTLPENSENTQQPYLTYTPLHRGALTLVDEFADHWRAGIEASYNSYQYRDDGTKTNGYFIFAASLQFKTGVFTFVLNGENLADSRQTKYEKVVTGPVDQPVFKSLWAPVDGRVINFSVMVRI